MLAAILKQQSSSFLARRTIQAAPMLAAGLTRRSFALTKYSFEDEDYDKSRWQGSQQCL